MDEREFSAIYESIEDSGESDLDEYVAVTEPNPYPYLCPEPKEPAPPPPPSGHGDTEKLIFPKKPKMKRFLPKLSHATTSSPPTTSTLPPQLDRHRQPAPPPKPRHNSPLDEPSSLTPKPRRPPKPSHLEGKAATKPQVHPRTLATATPPSTNERPPRGNQYYPQPGNWVEKPPPPPTGPPPGLQPDEEENQYDSIKETRKMLAIRRKQKKQLMIQDDRVATPPRPPAEPEEYIKMRSMSSIKDTLAGGRGEKEGLVVREGGQSRAVCILLGITLVSLLIAVTSLGLALYSTVAVSSAHCNTHFVKTSSSLQDNNSIVITSDNMVGENNSNRG